MFRVETEVFSEADYFIGLKYLTGIDRLHALCLPGVADPKILDASKTVCHTHKSLLITTESDLFDYLTN